MISATLSNKRSNSSVSEVIAETSRRKSSSSARSSKRTVVLRLDMLIAVLFRSLGNAARGRFHNLHAGAGPDAGRSRRFHRFHIFQASNTA